ncbi:hypothetical protein V6N12_038880 [Hibiscus sabdariffa]|uniref:Protein TIFY n=1 Tax=Hibiscus sabdariffa TaxID=183260 RepID=A0ABR2DZJ4_9ROSI
MFHDFLGTKAANSSVVLAPKASDARFPDASPSPSDSFAASSAGRGPISSTSDLGSERWVGKQLEGIPYYGPRSEISGPDISNNLAGSKRSNSDSAFMTHESLESLHMMKMLRNGAGGDRPRRSNEGDAFLGMKSMRHSSTSLVLQSTTGSRLEGNATKWERSAPAAVQYASRGGHFSPFMHQTSSNRVKDTNVGPSVISQAAADEGSRTGIEGPGIFSSVNASSVPIEKGSSGIVPSGERTKSGAHISETESLVPPSQQGLTTSSRQMTIFYAGQAHVFDDVHPNKADVVMALAGSNGGSWSTTYSPKSAVRTVGENYVPNGEPEAVGNITFSRELRGKTALAGDVSQTTGLKYAIDKKGDSFSMLMVFMYKIEGVPQGAVVMARDGKNLVQAAEAGTEEK